MKWRQPNAFRPAADEEQVEEPLDGEVLRIAGAGATPDDPTGASAAELLDSPDEAEAP